MSYPITKTELVSAVRQRTNTEGALDFCDDIEVGGYLNAAIAAWYDLVLGSTWGGDRYQRQHVFATSAGVELYERPQDLYKILSVDVAPSSFDDANVRAWSAYPYPKEDRNWLQGAASLGYPWSPTAKTWYRWVGANLSFRPIPQDVFYVRLNYAPTPPLLEAADDVLDVIAGWQEYIVLHASIRVLTKVGPYATIPLLQQQLAEEAARIRTYAPQADTNQAERVHILDSYDDYDVGFDADPWGGRYGY